MSAVPKLSPWFPWLWRPWLPGVYQREYRGLTHYSRWDGRFWYCDAATVESAAASDANASAALTGSLDLLTWDAPLRKFEIPDGYGAAFASRFGKPCKRRRDSS